MAGLPSTGSITMNQIHVEVLGASGSTCSLHDTDIRSLAGRASGSISMSHLRGKDFLPLSVSITANTNRMCTTTNCRNTSGFTVTASGGTGSYTYSWTKTGLATFSTSTTGRSVVVESVATTGEKRGTVTCKVTSGTQVKSKSASYTHTHGQPR